MSATVDIEYDSNEDESISGESNEGSQIEEGSNDGSQIEEGSNDGSQLEEEGGSSDEDDMMSMDESSGDEVQGSDGEEQKKGSLSNVLQNILKKRPGQKTIIMAKAKTDKQILASKKLADASEDEDAGSDDDSDRETSTRLNSYQQRQKKHHWEEMNRDKPDILNKDYERNLQKIATRGVVQLFNAVRKQQKVIDDKLVEAGSSIRRKDNAMSAISKGDFLDILQGHKMKVVPKLEVKTEIKEEVSD